MHTTTEKKVVNFTIDGKPMQAEHGDSIWEAAQRNGLLIANLCRDSTVSCEGNCRACVVEVKGERALAASCKHHVHEHMKIVLDSPRVRTAQKVVIELLAARQPDRLDKVDNELSHWADELDADPSKYAPAFEGDKAKAAGWTNPKPRDISHPAITVNYDACIQCARCVRACRETQGNDVLGMAGRGAQSHIVFDQGALLVGSSCVACGECVRVCPTGALAPANGAAAVPTLRTVDTTCPYCGVGCAMTYHIQNDDAGVERIARVEGRAGPANDGRLCVKGRFGFDYVANPDRLTVPLIRKPGVAKDPNNVRIKDWREVFREATWDEALEFAAGGLLKVREEKGGSALAGFGSAKGTNEEAYLFQKMVRAGFKTNNVDHCTRLCHASSVAALLEGLGSGSVSNPIADVVNADVVFLIGSNPTSNHPVGATWIKNAIDNGTKLILADPRRTELSRKAWMTMQFQADTDLALLNAMLYVLFEENLLNHESIKQRCHPEEVEAIRQYVAQFQLEELAVICGISVLDIREATRAYAGAKNSIIFWGMGVAQHVHGTDNVRALIALCMLTGQIGRPGTGLHPLRGQNNVQGASDAGLIPFMFPNYVRTATPGATEQVEDYWHLPRGHLNRTAGLTVIEITHAVLEGQIRAMYIEGENPAMSDPNVNQARKAFASLEHLVVQDIFLTETAALADVVLPASAWPEKTGTVTNTDRLIQMGNKAIASPGLVRCDLWIIQDISRRLGVAPTADVDMYGAAGGVREVFEEMRGMSPAIAGVSWERLTHEKAITHPCGEKDQPGQPIIFIGRFPTVDGRATLRVAPLTFAAETPDKEYPFTLLTGRELEHWHTGSMTRHASVLDQIEPFATASMNETMLAKLGVEPGQKVQIASRRGAIEIAVRVDTTFPDDSIFIPFAYSEAAANLLTNDALDPWGKIAEVKYCAVRVSKTA